MQRPAAPPARAAVAPGRHSVYGVTVESAFPLTGLPSAKGPAEVVIRPGDLSALPVPGGWYGRTEAGVLLAYPDLGLVLVAGGGKEVIVDARPGTDPDLIRACLLGPALGAVLQERGRLVLHASAVATAAGVVAFLGGHGSGKSTLAAALAKRGLPVVTDDALVLEGPEVALGHGTVRLWPDALLALGEAPTDHPRLAAGIEKRLLPAALPGHHPLRLRRIYLLEWGRRQAVLPVSARDAAIAFIAGSLFGFTLDRAGQARQFRQCVDLAAAVAVRRLRRPQRLDRVDAVAAFVMADLA